MSSDGNQAATLPGQTAQGLVYAEGFNPLPTQQSTVLLSAFSGVSETGSGGLETIAIDFSANLTEPPLPPALQRDPSAELAKTISGDSFSPLVEPNHNLGLADGLRSKHSALTDLNLWGSQPSYLLK